MITMAITYIMDRVTGLCPQHIIILILVIKELVYLLCIINHLMLIKCTTHLVYVQL